MSRTNETPSTSSRRLSRAAPLLAGVVVLVFLLSGLAALSGTVHVAAPSHSPSSGLRATASPVPARLPADLSPSAHLAKLSYAGAPFVPFLHSQVVVPHGPASSHSLRPVTPDGGPSSNSNFYANGSDCSRGAVVAAVGPSNLSLLSANLNFISAFNGSGGVLCSTVAPTNYIYTNGPDVTYTSSNGGIGWTPSYQTVNKSWVMKGSATNNSTVLGYPAIAAGANNKAFLASDYGQPCLALGTCGVGTVGYLAPEGISVSVSSNGGQTWAAPAQLTAINTNVPYFIPSSCGGPVTEYGPGNVSEIPSIAYDAPDHTAVVTWDVLHYMYFPNFSCTQLNLTSISDFVSVSSNDGVTWSAPKLLNAGLYDQSPSVAIGPSPNHNISILADDLNGGNATITSTGAIEFTFAQFVSSNKGVTFSSAQDIGTLIATEVYGAASPDSFTTASVPYLAFDNWSSSPYKGSQYAVWEDNQSGSYFGYAAIDITIKGPANIGWSAPKTITAQTKNTVYVMPSISVGPNGAVWVFYFGIDHSLGNVRMYGSVSLDGGSTWSTTFVVGDADSTPGNTIATLGPTTGVAATSAGAFPIWTDCRSSLCISNFVEELYSAEVHAVSITASVAGVNATLSTFGQNSLLHLPQTTGFDTQSGHTISVPQWFPGANASYVETFASYSGLFSSTNYAAGFIYTSGTALQVNYVATPAGWIIGTFAPVTASASLKVNGNVVKLTVDPQNSAQYKYNYTVAAGQTYTVNATAGAYYVASLGNQEPVAAHSATTFNIVLAKVTGTISGTISPVNITVLINGTSVTPGATGTWSHIEPWGFYWVNASSPGLVPFSKYYQVFPSTTTPVAIVLSGGWINGTVTNANSGLRVSIDGLTIPTNVGTFSVQVTGGFHSVAATQPGYNLSVIPNLKVNAGQVSIVSITLTNQGAIQGIIGPTTAIPVAVLHIYNATTGKGGFEHVNANGTFSVLFGAGSYTVNVTATGYNSFQTKADVSPGNVSTYITVTLVKNPTVCVGPNCNTDCHTTNTCSTTGNNATPANGLTTTDVIAIVAVIGIIVVAALVLLTRRRGGSGGSDGQMEGPPLEDQTYQGGQMSDLPHLQSDGTMDAGTMPPPPPPP